MPHQARQRVTGLLLALCLNAAFIAMFVWQARPRIIDTPDPSRIALVWPVPASEMAALPAPAGPVRQRTARAKPVARIPIAATEPAPGAEVILASDTADPFEKADSATAQSFDKAVMGKAIKVAIAERKALEDTQKFVKSGPGPTQYEQFAADVGGAAVPYCYRADAMKHAPPSIKIAGVTIGLTGVLGLPFFAKAIATGKCRMK
ncbi:hypothetical protein HHL21_00915 [Massilia sp. RP-1-19]|uniref:Uncharacterized protein n=1 Tax=Massilia polaris TaxID=2728846 RepID=A0A848HEK8_9BURK|nr:hypothetical protein [Massilia polaris]NML59674.1 hypothetical protein [Massilia polaris]